MSDARQQTGPVFAQLVALLCLALLACGTHAESTERSATELPAGLQWQTNNEAPILGSPDAIEGGRFRTFITSFPLTLRLVGPDSNGSFAGFLRANALGLVSFHPETREPIPSLASHWAFADDGRTVYYRLDPEARWSDGEPVTADDYLFTLEFMRSKFIVAPWYNNHYSKVIESVTRIDDYTIAVTGAHVKPREELLYEYGIRPTPEHFHQLDEHWVRAYNWKIEPTTGPYQIKDIRKGKYIEFEKIDNWWGQNRRYHRHRFNVKYVRVKVIRDINIAHQHFLKGNLDSFPLVLPRFWHKKAQGGAYDAGWIARYKFYNDVPQPSSGMYLNEDDAILQDRKIRLALAYAMNIEKVIRTVLRNDYERLNHQHEGYGDYTHPELKARPFDLAKANQLLDEAGWDSRGSDGIRLKDGKRLALRVTYVNNSHSDRLVILREEARKAGIDLELQLLDASTGFKQILEKKHQIAWMGWSGGGLSPVFWEFYHSDNAHIAQTNNITNTDNPKLDKLIMAYRTATDKASRIDLAHRLSQLIYEQASFIPTFKVPYARGAYWRWLQLPAKIGTRSSTDLFEPFGSTGGRFWIDDSEKQRIETLRFDKIPLPQQLMVDEQYRK